MNLSINLALLFTGMFEAYTHFDPIEQGIIIGILSIVVLVVVKNRRKRRITKQNRVVAMATRKFYLNEPQMKGYQAATAGLDIGTNPYLKGTSAHASWLDGYFSADEDETDMVGKPRIMNWGKDWTNGQELVN
jgi:ribosome modulation factor